MLDILQETVFSIQVCTDLADPAEIEREANAINRSGTSGGWHISRRDHTPRTSDEMPNPCDCAEHPGRRHWILDC